MGTELKEADCSAGSSKCNLTNEGGYDYRFRYLKNIMGLWMIQSVKKEIAQDMSFAQICEMAAKEDIKSVVDANADRFLAPDNMTEEVKKPAVRADSRFHSRWQRWQPLSITVWQSAMQGLLRRSKS